MRLVSASQVSFRSFSVLTDSRALQVTHSDVSTAVSTIGLVKWSNWKALAVKAALHNREVDVSERIIVKSWHWEETRSRWNPADYFLFVLWGGGGMRVCDVCVGWWCECVCWGGGEYGFCFCFVFVWLGGGGRGGRFCVSVSVWEEGRACVCARVCMCAFSFLFLFSFFFFSFLF